MARDFDGAGDHLDSEGGLVGVDVDTLSVACIINVDDVGTNNQFFIMATTISSGNAAGYSMLAVPPAGGGDFDLLVEAVHVTTWGEYKHSALSFNTDYSFIITRDFSSASNLPTLYLDGVNIGTLSATTAAAGARKTGCDSLRLGENLNGDVDFDGTLSEVAIWSRELTDTEAILITSGNSATHVMEGLQHYWPIQDWPYDHINGAELTVTGTTIVASPSINYRYPVIARATTTTGTTNAGSPYNMVVNMPNTRPDGDLYVFHITRNGDNNTISDPSGIQEFRDIAGNLTTGPNTFGGSMTYYVGRTIGATEPASYTFTSDGSGGASQVFYAKVIRIVGADISTVYGKVIQNERNNSTPAVADGFSVVGPDSLILRLYSVDTRIVDNVDPRDVELYAGSAGTYPTSVGSGCGISQGPPNGPVGTRNADLNSADDWNTITVEIRSYKPVLPQSPPWENFNKVKLVQSKYYTLNAAGTSRAVTFDNPTTPGNLIITCFTANKDTGAITRPTGFEATDSKIDNGPSVSGGMTHKISDGTETTITWTWASSQTGSSVWVGEFSGLGINYSYNKTTSLNLNKSAISLDYHGEANANPQTRTQFSILMHAMDTIMASPGLANLKFYPEMQVLFQNKISAGDEGLIIGIREDTDNPVEGPHIIHTGDSDQLLAIHAVFNVADKELPQGLYVPNSQLVPQLTMPNKKPIGNVMVDKFHPLAKGMIRAMLFQERAGAVTKDHYTGMACRVDDTCLPWGDAVNLSLEGNAVWLGGHNANLGIYPEGTIMFRGRALDTSPSSSETIFVTDDGYTKLCIYRGGPNTDLQVCAGGKETGHSVSVDIWDGETHEIAFFWQSSGNYRYLWIDGVNEVSAGTSTVNDVDLTGGFHIGEAGSSGCGWEFDYCYMYDYWIPGRQVTGIFEDPYQMFIPDSNF